MHPNPTIFMYPVYKMLMTLGWMCSFKTQAHKIVTGFSNSFWNEIQSDPEYFYLHFCFFNDTFAPNIFC